MLIYSNPKPKTTLQLSPKSFVINDSKKQMNPFLRGFLSFLHVALDIGASFLGSFVNTFAPGLGLVIEYGLSTALDLGFNAAINYGNINWQDFGISAGINAIPFVTRGIRYAANTHKTNKFFQLAKNLKKEGQEELSEKITKIAANYSELGVDKAKFIDQKSLLKKELKLFNNDSFLRTLSDNKNIYYFLNKKVQNIQKAFTHLRSMVSLLTSPSYLAKKAVDTVFKHPKAYLNKQLGKFTKLLKNTFKSKPIKKVVKKASNYIWIDHSSWLERMSINKVNNPWDIKAINAVLYFKKNATKSKKNPKGKEPVRLWNKSIDELIKLVCAKSPGRYYLNNIAYGHIVGRFIRKFEMFQAFPIHPIFSNLIETSLFTFRTINSLIMNFKRQKWVWLEDKNIILNEIVKGVKENVFKGWRAPGFQFISSMARSWATGNVGYQTKAALRWANKKAFTSKTQKTNCWVNHWVKNKYKK